VTRSLHLGKERVKVGKALLLCETLTGAGVGPKLNLLSPPQPSVKGKKTKRRICVPENLSQERK